MYNITLLIPTPTGQVFPLYELVQVLGLLKCTSAYLVVWHKFNFVCCYDTCVL